MPTKSKFTLSSDDFGGKEKASECTGATQVPWCPFCEDLGGIDGDRGLANHARLDAVGLVRDGPTIGVAQEPGGRVGDVDKWQIGMGFGHPVQKRACDKAHHGIKAGEVAVFEAGLRGAGRAKPVQDAGLPVVAQMAQLHAVQPRQGAGRIEGRARECAKIKRIMR